MRLLLASIWCVVEVKNQDRFVLGGGERERDRRLTGSLFPASNSEETARTELQRCAGLLGQRALGRRETQGSASTGAGDGRGRHLLMHPARMVNPFANHLLPGRRRLASCPSMYRRNTGLGFLLEVMFGGSTRWDR
jgi:hypothetical protein